MGIWRWARAEVAWQEQLRTKRDRALRNRGAAGSASRGVDGNVGAGTGRGPN